MRLRATQLRASVGILPSVTSLLPFLVSCAAGLAFVALSAEGVVTFRLRLTASLVAASCAALLDDSAFPTLASSPASLAIRRAFRLIAIGALLVTWSAATITIATLRSIDLQVGGFTREVLVLASIAVVAALVAQRWSHEGTGGSAGGLIAIGWFALSFSPDVRWLPQPPNPFDPRSSGALVIVAAIAAGLTLLLSRDPAR